MLNLPKLTDYNLHNKKVLLRADLDFDPGGGSQHLVLAAPTSSTVNLPEPQTVSPASSEFLLK